MFQFRAFPSYGYLVHRTILRYCLSVFPHSEISGSSLICSSPKLFAACHVLHRLLMPRHSPCALISLTFVRENCAPFRVPLPGRIRSASFPLPLQRKPASLGFGSRWGCVSIPSFWFSFQNYAGSTEDLTQNCIYPFWNRPSGLFPYKSSTMLFFTMHFLCIALCCLAFSLPLFSFQGAIPNAGMVENSGIEPLTS